MTLRPGRVRDTSPAKDAPHRTCARAESTEGAHRSPGLPEAPRWAVPTLRARVLQRSSSAAAAPESIAAAAIAVASRSGSSRATQSAAALLARI